MLNGDNYLIEKARDELASALAGVAKALTRYDLQIATPTGRGLDIADMQAALYVVSEKLEAKTGPASPATRYAVYCWLAAADMVNGLVWETRYHRVLAFRSLLADCEDAVKRAVRVRDTE